jgi:hypothetical protein
MRGSLLGRGSRGVRKSLQKLRALLARKLATERAWELKEILWYLWHYRSVVWAEAFWTTGASATWSRTEAANRVARMLHMRNLLRNWFWAKGEISSGTVEGLNGKIRLATKRSYGLRTTKP